MFIDYDVPTEQLTPQDIENTNAMQATIAGLQAPMNTNAEMQAPTAVTTGGQSLAKGE